VGAVLTLIAPEGGGSRAGKRPVLCPLIGVIQPALQRLFPAKQLGYLFKDQFPVHATSSLPTRPMP
jgi:hypothetical protein